VVIAFASCVGNEETFVRCAVPGLQRVAEPDSPIIEATTDRSIFEAYNEVLDAVAERDDLEALVLLHDDTELLDPAFCEKVRRRLADPDVGVIGVVGARDVATLSWWDADPFGHVVDSRGELDFGGGSHDVETVDGLLMVLSPRAVRELRFDADSFTGFHGYDADFCFQARAAGLRVVVDDIRVMHHTKGGYGNKPEFRKADAAWRRKWRSESAAASPAPPAGAAGVRAGEVSELGVYYEGDRPDLRELVPAGAQRILDVGCGAGGLGGALREERGAWVMGVEFFPQAAERARDRLDELVVADLDALAELPIPEESLDAMLFGDVLEHLRDPHRLLEVLRTYLAPDGVIVCSIPNVKHWSVVAPLLVADRFTYTDAGLLDRTHVHLFTLEEIGRMLRETGFDLKKLVRKDIPLPDGLEPLVDVAAGLGADSSETRARLSAYQYLVVATRDDA
jgi:SAM-dependent methyltransferase